MAEIWRLDLSPGPSVWLAGIPTTDGNLDVDSPQLDTPDPLYDFINRNEGCKYAASVGDAGVPGITVDPLYGSNAPTDWAVTAWVPTLFGPLGAVGSPLVAGKWICDAGRWIVRSWIDETVPPEAAYLLILQLYSGGLSHTPLFVGLFDDDGTNAVVDCDHGPGYQASTPFPWATIVGKYVEFDVKWNLSSDNGWTDDGWVTVRMRTSSDLSTWTDHGLVINVPTSFAWGNDNVGGASPGDPNVTYGYSTPLGYYGLPGAVVEAYLFDDDEDELVEPTPSSCSGGDIEYPDDAVDLQTIDSLRETVDLWLTAHWDEGTEAYSRKVAPINDPPARHYGKKPGRIVSVGQVVQVLGTPEDGHSSSSTSIVLDEQDHYFREKEESEAFLAREGVLYLSSDAARRADEDPIVLSRGAILAYPPKENLQRQIDLIDILARDFREYGQEEPLLKTKIGDLFPTADPSLKEIRIPKIYGRHSGGLSSSPAPIPSGDAALGAVFNAETGDRIFGFESLTTGPDAPLGLTIDEEAGGSIGLSHTPYDRLGFCAWCVDADGNEGDPFPYYESTEETITANGRQYRVTVTPPAGPLPHRIRVAIATIYYRPIWLHYIEIDPTETLEVVFTEIPTFVAGYGFQGDEITPGAVACSWYALHYYALAFRYSDGLSARSLECIAPRSSAYRRPARLSADIPSGAEPIELVVLKRAPGGTFSSMLVAPATQLDGDGRVYVVDDFLGTNESEIPESYLTPRGALPAYDTGYTETVAGGQWTPFVIQGAPSQAVLKVYAGSRILSAELGVTVLAPGLAGWTAAFGADKFRVYGDDELTVIYIRGSLLEGHRDGTAPITVDLCGIEDVGDGSGSTIRYAGRQVFHALNNFVFHRTKPSGTWNALATFDDGVAKLANFVPALEAIETTRIGEPYEGHLILRGDVTARELVRLAGISFELNPGIDTNGAFQFVHLDDGADLSAVAHYDHVATVFGSIENSDRNAATLLNVLAVSYQFDFVAESYRVQADEYVDQDSIDRERIRAEGTLRELLYVQNAAVALDVRQRAILRGRFPTRYVGWWTNFRGLRVDSQVGKIVTLTDVEGSGAGGFVRRPIFLMKRAIDTDNGKVFLWGLDLGAIRSTYRVLGPSDLTTYAGDTQAERDEYIYLSDADGLNTDGSAGFRMR